jgi:LysM repeat protein
VVTPGAPTPGPAGTPPPGARTYQVVPNDTLIGIAEKHGLVGAPAALWIDQLRSLNGFQGDNIQAGQTLQLPPGTPPPR